MKIARYFLVGKTGDGSPITSNTPVIAPPTFATDVKADGMASSAILSERFELALWLRSDEKEDWTELHENRHRLAASEKDMEFRVCRQK